MFTVATIKNNARDRTIGYQVVSQSKNGGIRYHGSIEAQHEASLERARQEMQTLADRLNAEAEANRGRG